GGRGGAPTRAPPPSWRTRSAPAAGADAGPRPSCCGALGGRRVRAPRRWPPARRGRVEHPAGPGREVGYRESVANPLGGPDPVVLRDVPLEIDPAEVRAFLSYRPPLRLPAAELAGRLETACAEIAGLLAPRVACRTRPVTHARLDHLGLAGGVSFAVPDIGRHWGPAA